MFQETPTSGKVIVAMLAGLALVLVWALPAQAADKEPGRHHHGHAVAAQHAASTAAASTGQLYWYGGPVQNYTKTYAIFWLPTGYTYEKGGSSANYRTLVERYLRDVGGSTFANPTTQYYDSSNWVSNSSTFVESVLDTSPYPVHNGYVYTTDADIRAEVVKWIKARGWVYGIHEQFFVFTASGVLTYDPSLGWSNNNGSTGYCAYHNTFSASSYGMQNVQIVYANMPGQDGHYPCYAKTFAGYNSSGQPTYYWYSPNGDYAADSAVSITSHEQFEMITDPLLNAWKDASGDENGDKCAYNYGTVATDTGNVTLNGHRYILQGEWSNAIAGCAWYRAYPYH